MQLPLSLQLKDDSTFDSFFPTEKNLAAYDAIIAMAQGHGEQFIYLSGAEGSGKTHLLHACCHIAPERKKTAVYIPCKLSNLISTTIFQGLEHLYLVCIDDIEGIIGSKPYEKRLLQLLTSMRKNNNGHLIISSAKPINQLSILSQDLKTELTKNLTHHELYQLTDEQKIAAIQLRAQCRGLILNNIVAKFLLRRCPNDMVKLFQTLEMLDQASFAAQRRLTIPFAKNVLGLS